MNVPNFDIGARNEYMRQFFISDQDMQRFVTYNHNDAETTIVFTEIDSSGNPRTSFSFPFLTYHNDAITIKDQTSGTMFSGPFSGCWMLQGRYNNDEPNMIAHVYTNNNSLNAVNVWNKLVKQNKYHFKSLVGFSPPYDVDSKKIIPFVLGAITPVGMCFSFLFDMKSRNGNSLLCTLMKIKEEMPENMLGLSPQLVRSILPPKRFEL